MIMNNYFDYAVSTSISNKVLNTMKYWVNKIFYNASADHDET